ncbi:hypothetical protein [Caulobacter hibisci]|uniref:Lipoprotein n=1 Tax=Caulobacter hibisci TaxID=2035993 RepID=A0ABS0SWB9_9CAUL|nr:hypothetical protein [Caulobacter hibisci]MBI1683899.1 hypothetical protein [Caulobacter hibisci]
MRAWALIMMLSVSGCAYVEHPSVGAIARIETGLAVLQDVEIVGVGDSEGINHAARTRVRDVRCSTSEAGRAVCRYEAARLGPAADWRERRQIFVRRAPRPGELGANGWTLEPAGPQSGDATEHRPSLYELGLWDPPATPKIRASDIPPPLNPADEETLFAHFPPGEWARALSAGGRGAIASEQVRKVTCVGLQTTYMLCSWEQHVGARWRQLTQYANISRTDGREVILIDHAKMEP